MPRDQIAGQILINEEIMKNWLEIAVGVYLLAMVLYGHYRGFIRQAVSMVALVATLIIVDTAMPQVTAWLKDNTQVHTWVAEHMEESLGIQDTAQMPAEQRIIIEGLNLPEDIKELLLENNNNQVYEILGVEAFTEYIGNYLANMILNLVGFVILFVVVYVMIRLLMNALDLMAKLPILSGLNQIAGALLGGVQGLFFIWIASLVITACSSMSWAMKLIAQIEASKWLSILYHYNFLSRLAMGILKGILS